MLTPALIPWVKGRKNYSESKSRKVSEFHEALLINPRDQAAIGGFEKLQTGYATAQPVSLPEPTFGIFFREPLGRISSVVLRMYAVHSA